MGDILFPIGHLKGRRAIAALQLRSKGRAMASCNVPCASSNEHMTQAGRAERRAGGSGHHSERDANRIRIVAVMYGCALVYA